MSRVSYEYFEPVKNFVCLSELEKSQPFWNEVWKWVSYYVNDNLPLRIRVLRTYGKKFEDKWHVGIGEGEIKTAAFDNLNNLTAKDGLLSTTAGENVDMFRSTTLSTFVRCILNHSVIWWWKGGCKRKKWRNKTNIKISLWLTSIKLYWDIWKVTRD